MKDNFEKFIEEHRSEFDVYEPREKLWNSIDEKWEKQRRLKLRSYWAAAASVVLLIGAVGVWKLNQRNNDLNQIPAMTVASEVDKAEQYYAGMIEQKRNELNRYCATQPRLCSEFDGELDTLNSMYGQLKHEYGSTADKEAVLQAMINNLQIQLQVLSRQLQVIQHVEAKQQKVI